jgi:uncharacterized protein
MPAKLDPTTVLSIPHPNSPRVFTSKLPSSSSLSSVQPFDPQALPSPSTPFANLSLLSPTASHSSNSSPLSPKLSTLTSFLLTTSTTSTTSTIPNTDACEATQMDVDKDPDPCDLGPTPCVCSSSPQTLGSSEPLTRVQSPPKSQAERLSPASSPHLSPAVPEPLVASDPPPVQPPPPKVPKVKMSLKDFAMRKKKQREEEQARAAALPSSSTSRNGRSVDVVSPDSDLPLSAAKEPGIIDGASEATAPDNVATTPSMTTESVAVIEGPTESSLYGLSQINGVHFDTSLVSTLAEIAQVIPPGKGCQLQDDVGAIKGSTPETHEVECNGDRGRHLTNVSPRSSRTPSPSLTESEDSETGNGMTVRGTLPPPTQPRSFTVNASASSPVLSSSGGGGALPHRLPPSSTYRPGSSYVPPSIPPSVRPLPSGPRALRAGMGGGFASGQQQQQSGPRGYGHHPHGHPHGPGSFAGVPRGPSSSVERERDRGWMGVVRGRGRGATSSWGR